ncbi:MAG: PAS domain-containing protein, partial [Flavobacteriales bacterium]|nr:PAS domain-containing protein [Flavobacteriales bacterium]
METKTEAGVESASKILPLLHILTDADLNITGLHHTHRRSKALLGDNSTYVGRHVSSIDVIRYLMRDHQWESLQKLMRGKWVEIRSSYKNYSNLKLQIVPILVQEELKGFIFRVEQLERHSEINGVNISRDEIIPANIQAILNVSQDIFFLKDQDFRFVFVNDAFCRFYQVKREDVIGKTDYDFLPKELADKYHYLDREAIEGKVITIADEVNMNDKVIEYKKFIIRDPIRKQPYIAVVARDVTYWRQIIHMLETKQREFEYFFNNNLFGAFFMMSDKPVEWNDAVDKEKVLDYLFEHQKVTRVNQEFLNQYRAKAEDIVGYRPADFFGEDIAQARRVWREFLDKGRLKTLTNEVRRDGTHMTVDGDYVAIYDDYGRFIGHFGVQQDVTEKMEQEKKLEEYRQLTEESFRVARMGGWEVDLLTSKFRWTSHLYEILEFQESFEPKLENIFDLVATESERNRIRLLLDNSVRTGERVDTEVQIITGKGRIIWISMSAVPVMKNNRCIKLFGIVQNIHDSKIKATQLLHSELRFKSIVDSAPGIIFVTDLKGRVTYISQNVEEFLGFPVEELVQK